MTQRKNSEIIEHILQTLIDKIGRRTSVSFAVVLIDTVIKELKSKYDFLKYIKIKNTLYSEGINAVTVMSEIDYVESREFFIGIKNLINKIIRGLERNADFFFIREFRDSLDNVIDLYLEEKGVNLDRMQFSYIDNRKEELKIKNSRVIEHVIWALALMVNQKFPEKQTIKIMISLINKYRTKYEFFKYLEITDKPDLRGFYTITALPEINNLRLSIVGEAIQDLIENVGKSLKWKDKESFLYRFENIIGEEDLNTIKRMGVKFNSLEITSNQIENQTLTQKSLEVLVDIIGEKTSKNFALDTMDKIIKRLEEKHDVLKFIKIEKPQQIGGTDTIIINPDINLVKSHSVGKAIKDIVKMIYLNLDEKDAEFLDMFKEKLGDEYLSEIENIGVNLYLLEMKFNLEK
jgi:hypothetical protein